MILSPILKGVLDMMSIDRINNLTQPYSDNTLYKTPVKRTPMNYARNNLSAATTPIMPQNHDLENVYDDLLRLPKMPKSPSEMEPIPSSEDELSRYNERRRENLLTLMNRRDNDNIDLKKYQLSAKYQVLVDDMYIKEAQIC